MRFAAKIIFLVRDPDGFGPAISNSLLPSPGSSLTKSESILDLSLASYGVNDLRASVDVINFLDPQGLPQVSVILLPNFGPPIAACAVREVLSAIVSESHSGQLTIILPSIMKVLKINGEVMHLPSSELEIALYAAEIGATTDFTQALIAKATSISSSLQLNCEPLACLVHMIRVLGMPSVLLVASDGRSQNRRTADYELEALCKVGQFLADHMGLTFSKDGLHHKQVERPRAAQEPWRALYL